MKLAYLIITYQRLPQAYIQMDLVKNYYSEIPELSDIDIYHTYNGGQVINKLYKEVKLSKTENGGLHYGAANLINQGMKDIKNSGVKYDLIILASSDVMFLNRELLVNSLKKFQNKEIMLVSSIWFFFQGLSSEFLIIRPECAKEIFPLKLNTKKDSNIFYMFYRKVLNAPLIESELNNKFLSRYKKEQLTLFKGREHIWWYNHRHDNRNQYYSSHKIESVVKIIKKYKLDKYTDYKKHLGL